MGYRAKLIKFFTFIGGLYFFLEFVLPGTIAGVEVDTYHDQISVGFTTVGAMALGLGLINLLMVHGSKIVFRRRGWFDSSALLIGLFMMTVVTASDWLASMNLSERPTKILNLREFAEVIERDHAAQTPNRPAYWVRSEKLVEATRVALADAESELASTPLLDASDGHADVKLYEVARQDLRVAIDSVRAAAGAIGTVEQPEPSFAAHQELGVALGGLAGALREVLQLQYRHSLLKQVYELLYQGFFVALGAAMFSLLGFYIAAAAYRAFRIKSAESALMMGAAVLVMLGQIPFGLWLWSELPEVRLWLLSVPSSGAFRAIKIGAAVAGLIMAYRMWLSIESESFSERAK